MEAFRKLSRHQKILTVFIQVEEHGKTAIEVIFKSMYNLLLLYMYPMLSHGLVISHDMVLLHIVSYCIGLYRSV